MAPALVWLRNEFRLNDNPALAKGFSHDGPVVVVVIEEAGGRPRPRGAASRWWLEHSLAGFGARLAEIGAELLLIEGDAETELPLLARSLDASAVYWNRRYGPVEREIDARLKQALRAGGAAVESLPGNTLIEPFDMATGEGKPYSVFTPFFRNLRQRDIPRPLHAPPRRKAVTWKVLATGCREPHWGRKLGRHWRIGEEAAVAALDGFLEARVGDYPEQRDIPAADATSRLSPHLAFGEISARRVWHTALATAHRRPELAGAVEKFLSELAWRDFNTNQLFHRPDIATIAMQPKFDALKWRHDPSGLSAWQQGRTGIPIVDAGMRELWETGFMQNRVRMLVGSLLSKNLLLDWRLGEAWFWDTLLDADPANNPGNWQWVAGSGLDAAPYFRIFNPVTQGTRFDADGAYVRRWVPELAKLADDWVHRPWEAPAAVLAAAGVALGRNYPSPIVDLGESRKRALAAFADL